MSILGGLGNLGGIGKLLDPGALVKEVVNGVLPKNMGVVGDLAGAFVDFKMGNPIGGVQHAMEALHDLPQAAKGTQQGAAGSSSLGLLNRNPGLEPPPPPLASRDGKPFDWNDLLSAVKALTAALAAHSTSAAPGATATTTGAPASTTATPATKPDAPGATSAPAGTPDEPAVASTDVDGSSRRRTTSTSASTGTARNTTSEGSGWRGEPPPAASASSSWRGEPPPAAPASPSNHTASPTNAAASSGGAPPAAPTAQADPAAAPAALASAPAAGAGQTITSVSQLQGMSDGAFKDAIRNGRISPEVAKDQVAMMAIQERMNSITQMNNLMTAMMRALHDMQMAIIQNIRI